VAWFIGALLACLHWSLCSGLVYWCIAGVFALVCVQWLGKTVLARLVTEIDDVNAMLVRTGSDDVQIGGQSIQPCSGMC